MSRSTWIKHPQNVKSTCHCTVLPLTLKAFVSIVTKYHKNAKLNWHLVEFSYISIVARVLQVEPCLVLSDNTANYHYEGFKEIHKKDAFLKTKYYRFIFQLTPY